MKRIIDIIDGVIPVIMTTAKEEAHGNIPVNIPTVIGFSTFESPKFPWSCPQSSVWIWLVLYIAFRSTYDPKLIIIPGANQWENSCKIEFATSVSIKLKIIAIIVSTKKWETNKLSVKSTIFWKSNFPPTVYAKRNVLPCPGSKACKHPNKKIDVIVIDHHLSEFELPKVHSIINPNRFDDDSDFKQMAAVGVTFLFLMALRKELREHDTIKQKEPNLLSYLDLVALGTVCDVVDLQKYNRLFVMKGLELQPFHNK